ncbi:hypothetical protein C3H43_06920 [Campylobacter jejuni]|uniref:hypothetical protein n=1 Tax=Campylobacter jejuni TaxID=197 RepID=UPI000F80E1B0|nr:hypothetical protein [Campylobacter jejuni]RTJ93414.1 hypothetical protein C3H43_06920 [Campylobacter jejuni]
MNFKTLSIFLFFVNFFIASSDDTQVLDFIEQEERGQIYQDIVQNLRIYKSSESRLFFHRT